MITPTEDNVVVRRATPETQTPGGLFIPTRAQAENVAEVVAVGPGRLFPNANGGYSRIEPCCGVGDRVLLRDVTGTPYREGGTEYLVVNEAQVLAVLG